MPTKRPPRLDTNQLAKRVVDQAVGEAPPIVDTPKVRATRAAGTKGGRSRASALTPAQRAEIARVAAQARWKKKG